MLGILRGLLNHLYVIRSPTARQHRAGAPRPRARDVSALLLQVTPVQNWPGTESAATDNHATISARLKRSGLLSASGDGRPHQGRSTHPLHGGLFAPEAKAGRTISSHPILFSSLCAIQCIQGSGESAVDAFTIMRIAGHSRVVVSQRHVHPSPVAVERAFERLQLSGDFAVYEPKRLPAATVSATLAGRAAVSH